MLTTTLSLYRSSNSKRICNTYIPQRKYRERGNRFCYRNKGEYTESTIYNKPFIKRKNPHNNPIVITPLKHPSSCITNSIKKIIMSKRCLKKLHFPNTTPLHLPILRRKRSKH